MVGFSVDVSRVEKTLVVGLNKNQTAEQARVSRPPVEVLPCQCLAEELAVVGDPPLALIILLCPNDGGLVGEQFWGLVGEPSGQERCHEGVALQPQGNVCDWQAGRGRWASWSLGGGRRQL